MKILGRLGRRKVLRGMLQGSAVSVALPYLDCLLNSNGNALASGAPLPVRYGTWFYGCGLNPGRWAPKDAGPLKQLGPELAPLEHIKNDINVYSGTQVFLDGKPLLVHTTGNMAQITGSAPGGRPSLASIDTLISDVIGTTTRFRSLEASCDGDARTCYSFRAGGVPQASEISPAKMYARIFGPEFVDPNGLDFKPDPLVMAQKSVLSATADQRVAVMRDLGASDRARLDEYFSSVRQLEQQIELQLQKPPPLEACSIPKDVDDPVLGTEVETGLQVNALMMGLITHALACDQTRVFNLAFAHATSRLRFAGDSTIYHGYTHEEAPDQAVGYQRMVAKFGMKCMEGFAKAVEILKNFREGDGTLLDRTLMTAYTDTGYAAVHSVVDIPVFTAGRAGGAMKTGLHVIGRGDPATRIGLTAMQALKLPVNSWGTESMQTSKTISEVLA